jgi:hypothetical protein
MTVSDFRGKDPIFSERDYFVDGRDLGFGDDTNVTEQLFDQICRNRSQRDEFNLEGRQISPIGESSSRDLLEEATKSPYVDYPVLPVRKFKQIKSVSSQMQDVQISEIDDLSHRFLRSPTRERGESSGSSGSSSRASKSLDVNPDSKSMDRSLANFFDLINNLAVRFPNGNVNNDFDMSVVTDMMRRKYPQTFSDQEAIDLNDIVNFVLSKGAFFMNAALSEKQVASKDIDKTIGIWMQLKRDDPDLWNNFLDIVTKVDLNPDDVDAILTKVEKKGFTANSFWQQWLSPASTMVGHVTPYFLNHPELCVEATDFLNELLAEKELATEEKESLKLILDYLIGGHKDLFGKAAKVNHQLGDANVVRIINLLETHVETVRKLPEVLSILVAYGQSKPEQDIRKTVALVETCINQLCYSSEEIANFIEGNIAEFENHTEVKNLLMKYADENITGIMQNPEIFYQQVNGVVKAIAIHDAMRLKEALHEEFTFSDAKKLSSVLMQAVVENPLALASIGSNAEMFFDDMRNDKETVLQTLDFTRNAIISFNETMTTGENIPEGVVSLVQNTHKLLDSNPQFCDALMDIGRQLVPLMIGNEASRAEISQQQRSVFTVLSYLAPQVLANDFEGLNKAMLRTNELVAEYPDQINFLAESVNSMIEDPSKLSRMIHVAENGLQVIDAVGRPDYRPAPFEASDGTLDLDEQLYAVTKKHMGELRGNLIDEGMNIFEGVVKVMRNFGVVERLNIREVDHVSVPLHQPIRILDRGVLEVAKQLFPVPSVAQLAYRPIKEEYQELVRAAAFPDKQQEHREPVREIVRPIGKQEQLEMILQNPMLQPGFIRGGNRPVLYNPGFYPQMNHSFAVGGGGFTPYQCKVLGQCVSAVASKASDIAVEVLTLGTSATLARHVVTPVFDFFITRKM